MPSLIAYLRVEPAPSWSPILPPSWEVTIEVPGRITAYPQGRSTPNVRISFALVARDPSFPPRGLFVATGPQGALDALAASVASDALAWTRTWPTLAIFRAEASALVTRLKGAWVDDRRRLQGGTPEAPIDLGPDPAQERYALRTLMAPRNGADASEQREDGES